MYPQPMCVLTCARTECTDTCGRFFCYVCRDRMVGTALGREVQPFVPSVPAVRLCGQANVWICYPCVHPCVCASVRPSVRQSTHPSILHRVFVRVSVDLSIYPSVQSVHLCVCPSALIGKLSLICHPFFLRAKFCSGRFSATISFVGCCG